MQEPGAAPSGDQAYDPSVAIGQAIVADQSGDQSVVQSVDQSVVQSVDQSGVASGPSAFDANGNPTCIRDEGRFKAPAGFESFQAHLQQCFLNCIARKNAAQKTYNTFNIMSKMRGTSANKVLERKKAIMGALESVLAKANAGGLENTKGVASISMTLGLQANLEQCFLNCIKRKNAVQMTYNKGANARNAADDSVSSKTQRKECIINALKNIIAKAQNDTDGLANYVLTSFKDAGKNYYNNTGNAYRSIGTLKTTGRGGKKTRKARKVRKTRKARKANKGRKSRK